MAAMTEITCACGCGLTKMVRTSDVKRGWGKYINKSHKARHQERKTGQYREYLDRQDDEYGIGHPFASGYYGHGQE